jgi:hypothetical protein
MYGFMDDIIELCLYLFSTFIVLHIFYTVIILLPCISEFMLINYNACLTALYFISSLLSLMEKSRHGCMISWV